MKTDEAYRNRVATIWVVPGLVIAHSISPQQSPVGGRLRACQRRRGQLSEIIGCACDQLVALSHDHSAGQGGFELLQLGGQNRG